MYGTITKYMGTAYTGLGVAHKYTELIASATETVFLKCPPTTAVSGLLNQIGSHYVKRKHHIEKFMNPVNPEQTDAVFIKGPNILYIQASHPVSLEPTNIGGRHRVVSFYDIYDEQKLREQNKGIAEKLEEADQSMKKTLAALAEAKSIHDDWEAWNINRMMWKEHESLIATLKEELFGTIELNKKSTVSHRLIGSLTSTGACDFIPSITERLERRLLIKGFAGTGKSTIMKALGSEAERRGFDVLYGWCGLDPEGVDLVSFPELSICLFDATKPHVYEPEGERDEILNLESMCKESKEVDEEIAVISEAYKEKILDATGYMQSYTQAENIVKATMDAAIQDAKFNQKAQNVLDMN